MRVIPDRTQVTLAVLAGGRSRRMGAPKSHLRVAGRPILQFLLDRFAWPGPTLLVTAPGVEHPPAAERFDAEAIDPVADQGPLRGVLTALEHASTPALVVVTVDMPNIGVEHLSWLLDRLGADEQRLGVMSFHEGRVEPLPLACRSGARSVVAAQLEADRRSIQALGALPRFTADPVPASWPAHTWTNLNFPADYDAFIATLSEGGF